MNKIGYARLMTASEARNKTRMHRWKKVMDRICQSSKSGSNNVRLDVRDLDSDFESILNDLGYTTLSDDLWLDIVWDNPEPKKDVKWNHIIERLNEVSAIPCVFLIHQGKWIDDFKKILVDAGYEAEDQGTYIKIEWKYPK